ncbi:MAG: hypothetical protein GOV15_04040 [Candidatus Diapherotrites archaeon]|nr:hypothetical protein [Candidatus Diapherotrites archaeon]
MENKLLLSIAGSLLVGLVLGAFTGPMFLMSGMDMSDAGEMSDDMDSMRDSFISLKQDIQGHMMSEEMYSCCLETPCVYCIEKSPGHGEGAECSCLDDVMNGVHPCGECIGEIMEGHGNVFLAPYFATAIAEKVGVEHTLHLKEIMADMYDITVEEQVRGI